MWALNFKSVPCWIIVHSWLGLAVNAFSQNRNQSDDPLVMSYHSLSTLEKAYLEVPSATSAKSNLRFITQQPHVAGTKGDEVMAEFMVQELQQAGIPNVTTFELEVYLNYPQLHRRPKLILKNATNNNHTLYRAKLSEPILPNDDDTSDVIWRNHTFHGYSPAGHIVGASMVYANYGRPQDFQALQNAGISVNGTVVLVRYGKCFRGLKVQNAQQRGAVGVLIYSDPAEDGYGPKQEGDAPGVYPNGPWRPPLGVQRGSVQFNSQCGGDPFRADPRYEEINATIQTLCGVESPYDLIPSIPSLPISYEDATPLLQHIGGLLAKDVAEDFVGGIHNLTYRVGPSTNHTTVDMNVYNTKPARRKIPNVIGIIPGQLPPSRDMPVLLGNHRDAWVYGAADPNSGTAALIEVAKGLGTLYQDLNWRPLRTIYLLSWSGEEYGLLGSTGWGELNAELIKRAVAYLNVDTVVSGDLLQAKASPSLMTLWNSVLKDWNETDVSHELYDTNTGRQWNDDSTDVGVLGSGSDYTVFLDHLGIPCLDFSFDKHSGTYGQYHSVYDSFAWMDQFGGRPHEPGSAWELMETSAKIWGLLGIRLAQSAVVPLDPIAQGAALAKYAKAVESQKLKLKLSSIHTAVQKFQKAAAKLQIHCQKRIDVATVDDPDDECNEKLGLVERQFLLAEGLPKRPWFKHTLQAPGMHLGYAAEVFPGVQQAIDDQDLDVAQEQIEKVAERIEAAAKFLSL